MTPPPSPQKDPEDAERQRAREAERIQELRERLYARGEGMKPQARPVRHDLSTTAHTTPQRSFVSHPPVVTERPVGEGRAPLPADHISNTAMSRTSFRTTFRLRMVIVGILFLIGALAVSSAFLFFGTNTISGNNISIDVFGPVTVGGGDAMNLQIGIANNNSLPIESATLIIAYPRGAQSATEPGKELFTDRQQLNNIDPNEVVNVPVRFLIFGEENDQKEVNISIEYRVSGSNATFYKEAPPFVFKISSSPVIVNVTGDKSLPSGQETELEVVVQSNAKETLKDLVLKLSYPQGFDLTGSSPETVSGQDTWKIASLKPGEQKKISIKGVIVGNEGDDQTFSLTVGVANERDAFNIVSPLAVTDHTMSIEKPFLEVEVDVNGSSEEVVVIDPTASARVNIQFRNALDSTIYDGVILVELDGNALNEIDVSSVDGHYDSKTNMITWDPVGVKALEELAPGKSSSVSFSVTPRSDIDATPEIRFVVTTKGNRVGEDRVPEEVVGTIARTIRIASVTELDTAALYTEGPFTNSGPIPPVAEETTQYTLLFSVKNGTNPVTDAEVTAVMPPYMSWLDMTSDDDSVRYSASNRTLKWSIDELEANEYKEVWIQVAFTPSLSQVNLTPTILETQRFKATDRFTGTTIRSEAPALTTFLSEEPDASARDGRVVESN